jgi:hypothetical protein
VSSSERLNGGTTGPKGADVVTRLTGTDGYHLSELNFPVTSLTCLSPAFPPPSRLPLCLGLTAGRYSFITAIFTVGGLMGSLMSSWVVQKEGLKGGIAWTGYLNLFGVIGMAMAPHWWILAIGRSVMTVHYVLPGIY